MRPISLILALFVTVAVTPALAEVVPPPPGLEPLPDAAPPPDSEGVPLPEPRAESPADAAGMEPEVTIIERKTETVEEYRINGRLYMVKITPRKGFPYYLVDSDGDGRLDTRENELDPKIVVPRWMIFRWK